MADSATKVKCKAYPAGSDAAVSQHIMGWCKRNMHRALCRRCKLFPIDGPDVSVYQLERSTVAEK